MNNELIERLVRDYSRLVFTVCYRMIGDYHEAENLTQDTFISAMNALERFEGENYKAFLVTIASNKCRDLLKSARMRRSVADGEEVLPFIHDRSNVEEEVMDNALGEALQSACHSLNEQYKTVAILRFVEQKEYAEMAKLLSRDVKTVTTQVYRAREKLKSALKEWEFYETTSN